MAVKLGEMLAKALSRAVELQALDAEPVDAATGKPVTGILLLKRLDGKVVFNHLVEDDGNAPPDEKPNGS